MRAWTGAAAGAFFGAAVTIVPAPPAVADGVRPGPLESVCVALPESLKAVDGDVAIASITVTEPSGPGYVIAHSDEYSPVGVSSLNFPGGATVPNLAAARVTEGGVVCVTGGWSASEHVIVDAVGLIKAEALHAVEGGTSRLLDTRDQFNVWTWGAPVAPNGTVCVPGGRGEPAVAISNVTVTEPGGAGYLTVHAVESATPSATSTHNYSAGQTVANLTFTPLAGATPDELCATASEHASAHVIVDRVGWLRAEVFSAPEGGARRLLDTRLAEGPTAGAPVGPGQTVCAPVPGGAGGDVALVNAAIVDPDSVGFATVHNPQAVPGATSTNNFAEGQTVGNLTATTLTPDGQGGSQVCATPSPLGSAHVVLDLIGRIHADAVRALPDGAVRLLDTRTEEALPGPTGDPVLDFGESCDSLHDYFVDRQQRIIEHQYGDDPAYKPFDDGDDGGDADSPGPAPAPAIPATSGGDGPDVPDYSGTNTQVDGIDEGDVVETDGRYVFALDGDGLAVVDTVTATVVADVAMPNRAPLEMILAGDRLLVTSLAYAEFPFTLAEVYDVTDRTHPTLVSGAAFEGSLHATRSIDGNARLVLAATREPALPSGPDTTVADLLDAAAGATVADWLPRRATLSAGGLGPWEPALACGAVAVPSNSNGGSIVYVGEVRLDASSPASAPAGVVYAATWNGVTVSASFDHLYVAVAQQPEWWQAEAISWADTQPTTALHAFRLTAHGPAEYAATHVLPGRVVDQFAIGEHAGVVRVAITAGWWDQSASSVFALRRVGSTFARLSVIPDLGRGEQIQSVRHVGPVSYVVTFRQIDPLYVADFSDPLRPELQGELKIPGFSSYLHPIGAGRLVGVGQDATEFGQVTGAQLSLFDVGDPRDPQRIDTMALGYSSEAESDHHAFLWWAPANLIAVPTYDSQGPALTIARVWNDRLVFGGWIRPAECDGFRRSIVIGDEIVAVGSYGVTIAAIGDLAVRARVSWAEAGVCPGYPTGALPPEIVSLPPATA